MRVKTEVEKGTKFGELTVLAEAPLKHYPSGQTGRRVYCQCECGKINMYSLPILRTGKKRSCGCVKKRDKKRDKIRAIFPARMTA